MTNSDPVSVFFIYQPVSPIHNLDVVTLAQRLRRSGIDARLDRFVSSPAGGWLNWHEQQMEIADFILVVRAPILPGENEVLSREQKALHSTRLSELISSYNAQLKSVQAKFKAAPDFKRVVSISLESSDIAPMPNPLADCVHFELPEQQATLEALLVKGISSAKGPASEFSSHYLTSRPPADPLFICSGDGIFKPKDSPGSDGEFIPNGEPKIADGEPIAHGEHISTNGNAGRNSGVPKNSNLNNGKLNDVFAAPPLYANLETRALSENLEALYLCKKELSNLSQDLSWVNERIKGFLYEKSGYSKLQNGDFLSQGRYRLLKEMGHGEIGAVWQAFDYDTGGPVAVKVLHDTWLGASFPKADFYSGLAKIGGLQHPNILRVLDAGEHAGRGYFFVMPFWKSFSLYQAVVDDQIDRNTALCCLSKIASALDYAHAQNIVHGDVKPQNIFLNEHYQAKLVDFDLRTIIGKKEGGPSSSAGGSSDSGLYGAPETKRYFSEIDHRADIYSLAMVAAFVLHGQKPPADAKYSLTQFINKLSCEESAQKVILNGIAASPEERFQSAGAFCTALLDALGISEEEVLPSSDEQKTNVDQNTGLVNECDDENEPLVKQLPKQEMASRDTENSLSTDKNQKVEESQIADEFQDESLEQKELVEQKEQAKQQQEHSQDLTEDEQPFGALFAAIREEGPSEASSQKDLLTTSETVQASEDGIFWGASAQVPTTHKGQSTDGNDSETAAKIALYQKALSDNPSDKQAIAGLKELYRQGIAQDVIGQFFETHFTNYALWLELVSFYFFKQSLIVDDKHKAAVGHIIKEICQNKLTDLPEADSLTATAMLKNEWALYPENKIPLEQLVYCYYQKAQWTFIESLLDNLIRQNAVFSSIINKKKRAELLVKLGELCLHNLGDENKRLYFYDHVDVAHINDIHVLYQILSIYQEAEKWPKLITVLKRICKLESEGPKLAQLYWTAGLIYRDNLHQPTDAIDCFNNALDADLSDFAPFDAIETLLTETADYVTLETNIRKMLHRIINKGRPDIELVLWQKLGEVCFHKLGFLEEAAEAFKMALALDPDNIQRRTSLAALYGSIPNRQAEAVGEYHTIISKDPYAVDAYKSLRKLYFDTKEYDKAWCLCATLCFLHKADDQEQQFYEQYKSHGFARFNSRLTNDLWVKELFYPEESLYIGKIFQILTRAIRSIKVQPKRFFGLKDHEKRLPNDTLTFSKTFYHAANVLNLPVVPDLYIKEDQPGGLNFAITDPMISACGASLLTGYAPKDLMFIVAKHLTYYRPEHYLRWLMPTQGELELLLLAALKIGNPNYQLPAAQLSLPQVQNLENYIDVLCEHLDSIELENLAEVTKRFIAHGEKIDVGKWLRAVDITACRTGLIMTGDLDVATKMIQAEYSSFHDLPPKEKIIELAKFSVSESYFKLRAAMGITVNL